MALKDYSDPDRDALLRTEFVKATNRVIPQSVLQYYQWVYRAGGDGGPVACLLDIWENRHYHPDQIPTQ